MMRSKRENFSAKPCGNQAAIACTRINRIASSVGRKTADCLSYFTSKSKVHIAHDDMVPDLIEQDSF